MLRHLVTLAFLVSTASHAQLISNPTPIPVVDRVPIARDVPYPGTMILNVDATDIEQNILKVAQTIPVAKAGPMTLLFPKWLPGNHAPRGEIEKLAGLVIKAGGKSLAWKRDPLDVFAFHIDVPAGAKVLEIAFQFLSATADDQGRVVVTPEMLNIQWNSVSLYPAGYYIRQIPVVASATYPDGWKAATALRPSATRGNLITYQPVNYEVLVDSPVFAGKYFRSEPLSDGFTLNIVADDAKNLVIKPEQLAVHKRLTEQAVKLFGTRQFDHYDFLLALTEKMGRIGLEHHRSSENGVNPAYFTDWDSGPGRRNLLAHELTHSWDGKHRRPQGQVTPDFRTPLVNDLLWVYEGQTQFWGYVLGARSGLFSKQDTLDALASIAASLDISRARDWRALEDTTNDPLISARRPKGWSSWQRSEDYYNEGMLIWLEVDAMIRTQTGGAKGMDDFARTFFGTKEGDYGEKAYTFEDVALTLNSIAPYDWAAFLTKRLNEKASGAPLGGFSAGGYTLTFVDEPTPFIKDSEKDNKIVNLTYSLGGTVGKGAKVTNVIWDGPLFKAGLVVGAEIIAVNGRTYSDEVIKDAVKAAKGGKDPIRLIIKSGDRVRDILVQWNGGLRYPKFIKSVSQEGSLDMLLKARN
jgi:predicted metalloprotease with PDZ domain